MSGSGVPVVATTDAILPQFDTELLGLCAAFLRVRTSASTVPGEEDLALALQERDSLAGQIGIIAESLPGRTLGPTSCG